MNIVVATDFAFVNGGAAQIALGSAKGLAARGHHVTLFTGVGPIASDLRDVPGLTHVCLEQHDVWGDPNRLRAAGHSIWNHKAALRMRALLSTMDPAQTVVHLHSWTKALSSSVTRAATEMGFRVVLTLHDFLSVCPNGTFFNYTKGERCHLQPLSSACIATNCDARGYSHKLWRVGRHAVQASIGHLPPEAGDFVTISEASDRVFGPFLPAHARLHHVPNFVDMPRLDPVPVARNDFVIYIGRLSPEKGAVLLAESTRRLQVPAVFVGDGVEVDAVRARYPAADVTGWLSPECVRERLRQARVLVVPSLWFEIQGLVVIEAASMGVPAIVPDTSGAADWVINGTTGLWFRAGDVDDLSRKIAMVMDNSALATRMGQAAYERFWSAPPTVERHAEQLEGVYGSVLRRGATSPRQRRGKTNAAINEAEPR